ncbi:MAG: hypothetical protein KF902_04325 [Phycisphaeraceae bacterium]|nr:hypothetical protein [Phycisphaeraceae bacterium]
MAFNTSRLARSLVAFAVPLTVALPALAGLPGAIDRLPTDALAVISIRSVSELKADLDQMGNKLPPLKEALASGPIGMILAIPGMNAEGSVAAAFVGSELDFDADQPPMVAVIPVKDAKQFFTGIGASASGDTYTADFDGNPAYLRDIGGGFVAMAPTAELLASFDGKPGKGAAHSKRLGSNGSALAETADLLVFADLAKLKPMIDQGMAQMKQQMEMVAMMAGPQGDQMKQTSAMIETIANILTSQGDLAIMGTTLSAAGVAMDFGAQFKEGTDAFKALQVKGDSMKPLTRLPNVPYLFAMSADISSPAMKNMLTAMNAMQAQGSSFLPGAEMMDKLNAMSFVLGTSPALMGGGLFANSVVFHQTNDAPGLLATTKDVMAKMNNTSANGMKLATTYKQADTTIGGTPVDSWAVRMSVDPNDPNAMMAQQGMQAMFMIWGPTAGPSGYLAPSKNGVVQTLSKNSMLLEKSLQVASDGNGLGADKTLAATATQLPSDRSAEMYLGVGEIIKTAAGFAAMMGMPMEFAVKDNLPPVGMSMSTSGGAASGRLFVPMDVITTVADIQKQMQGDMGDPMDDGDGSKPRF